MDNFYEYILCIQSLQFPFPKELRSLIHSKLICKLEWDSDIPRSVVYKRKFSVDIKITGPVDLIPQVSVNIDGVVKQNKVIDEKGTTIAWFLSEISTERTNRIRALSDVK